MLFLISWEFTLHETAGNALSLAVLCDWTFTLPAETFARYFLDKIAHGRETQLNIPRTNSIFCLRNELLLRLILGHINEVVTNMKLSDIDGSHFGLCNIPFGIASRKGRDLERHPVTRLHDEVFFLPELASSGLLNELGSDVIEALHQPELNQLAALGRSAHRKLRAFLQAFLTCDDAQIKRKVAMSRASISDVDMHLPVKVGDFSDFSCSLHHVLNAGEAVLGMRSEPPGFRHFPVGYTGRCSTIFASGVKVRRPLGQFRSHSGVTFGPSEALDFELEVACVIGKPSRMGVPVPVDEADEHIFGFVLLNDWSARDIQGFEMNPLGPFNGKSFCTCISPWIVTADALEPYKLPVNRSNLPGAARSRTYLTTDGDDAHYAMTLQSKLITSSNDGLTPPNTTTVCTSKLESLYWTFRDMIAHQTINGCALRAGDLLATGTVSGEIDGSHGCLLESTRGGKQPITLKDDETGVYCGERRYLEDSDVVILTGWGGELGTDSCVGFGSCRGTVATAFAWKSR